MTDVITTSRWSSREQAARTGMSDVLLSSEKLVVRKTFLELRPDEPRGEHCTVPRRDRALTDWPIGVSYGNLGSGHVWQGAVVPANAAIEDEMLVSERPLVTGQVGPADAPMHDARQMARAASPEARRAEPDSPPADQTSVMLKNIPKSLTRQTLLEILDLEGFSHQYDFIYLPIDFRRLVGFGYAIVNFVTHAAAAEAMRRLEGRRNWPVSSSKICTVVWAGPLQGLTAHLERYRDSPLMHPDVPECYKPLLLVSGEAAPFPAPTRTLKVPRKTGRSTTLSSRA